MFEMCDTKIVEIPIDIYSEEVVENLEKGLGYRAIVLDKNIFRIIPPDSSLPELVMLGNLIMVVDEKGDAQRLVDLIQILQKRRSVT
ncbi:MAG: hypothetical protein ACTSV2_06995 [Candidatus Thorarchaeota archaeon]